jgi:hypothetical protein
VPPGRDPARACAAGARERPASAGRGRGCPGCPSRRGSLRFPRTRGTSSGTPIARVHGDFALLQERGTEESNSRCGVGDRNAACRASSEGARVPDRGVGTPWEHLRRNMRPERPALRTNLAQASDTPSRGQLRTQLRALWAVWPVEVRVVFGAWKKPRKRSASSFWTREPSCIGPPRGNKSRDASAGDSFAAGRKAPIGGRHRPRRRRSRSGPRRSRRRRAALLPSHAKRRCVATGDQRQP